MTIRSAARRRGVMLVEMLLTIGLIAIFLVIAGKLFTTTLRLLHTSQNAARDVAAYESAVAALRRDAWGAVEVVALPAGGVRITRGDATAIAWSADDDAALARRAGEAVQRWPGVGSKLTLHPDPAGILIRAGDDGELRLTSQVLLARKGAP